ncbi:MAG: thiamine pyrophosphate-dependent enzyme [Dehalococcoidia bacterium]
MRMTRDYEEPFDEEPHWTAETVEEALAHPVEWALRADRLPHIWCAGCGIGTAMSSFTDALREAQIDLTKLAVVSGIGCTGRVAGYMNCDGFHTTHGRAVPFALGLHLGNPELEVVVFSGDGDIVAIGGNHLIHTARRNADLTVLCVNNFNYGMTGGQSGPTTQEEARTVTTPYGNIEHPFNFPMLMAAVGATYVARWTILDMGRLTRSIVEALQHKGFAFVEIVSPCPVNYGRRNKLGEAADELRYYKEKTVVKNFAPLEECDLSTVGGKIVVGKFVEMERPTFLDLMQERVYPMAQQAPV